MSSAENDNADERPAEAMAREIRRLLRRPLATAERDPLELARAERDMLIPSPPEEDE